MTRMTTDQLANFEASLRADAETGTGLATVPADDVAEVFAELRELRALLDTPMPGLAPRAVRRPGVEYVEYADATLWPNEAIALGAALIRAGRKASNGE